MVALVYKLPLMGADVGLTCRPAGLDVVEIFVTLDT